MSDLTQQILFPEKLSWRNGVPYSERFSDIYSSQSGVLEESSHVFVRLNDLPTRWSKATRFQIGEIGFGAGINFLTTVSEWLAHSSSNSLLHYWSAEKYPLSKLDIESVLKSFDKLSSLTPLFLKKYPALISGAQRIVFPEWRVILTLNFSDALTALKNCEASFDAWYLDGFSPSKNQELWSKELFGEINRLSHQNSTLSTYSVASMVRENLSGSGFECRKVEGIGLKAESLVARFKEKLPLSQPNPPWFSLPKPDPNSSAAIIIGAGLAGSAAAFSLALRGFKVTVIDTADSLGSGASGNPQGAVVPYLSGEPSKMSRFYLQGLTGAINYLSLLSENSALPLWQQTGSLQLPSSERLKRLLELIKLQKLNSQFVTLLDQGEASSAAGVTLQAQAAYFPTAGFANPKECCSAALNYFGDQVTLMLNSEVTALNWSEGRWYANRADGSSIASAPICVIANGIAATKYPQTNWLPLEPVRGQICQIPKTTGSATLNKVLCYDGYVFPEVDGSHVLGATFEHGNLSSEPTKEASDLLISRLSQWINLSPLPQALSQRVSFRVSTHDRLPFIGAVPDQAKFEENYREIKRGFPLSHYPKAEYLPGLYLSLGHGSRGLISTWLAAEILSGLILAEPLPLERDLIDAVNPARFLVKKLRKAKAS